MAPHRLAQSSIPVQVYDFALENTSDRDRSIALVLRHRDQVETRGATVWTLRDGKVIRLKIYQSTDEALKAVGLKG